MSMCTSGSLSICSTAGIDRSIATAVTNTTSGSLLTNSICAGKSAPHSMLEFYGYSSSQNIGVNLTHVGSTTISCLTSITQASTSSSYCISVEFRLSSNGLKSYPRVCLYCNGICKYGCDNQNLVGYFPTFIIDSNDGVCLCTLALKGLLVSDWATSCACINTITTVSGSVDTFYKGTPNSQISQDGTA